MRRRATGQVGERSNRQVSHRRSGGDGGGAAEGESWRLFGGSGVSREGSIHTVFHKLLLR